MSIRAALMIWLLCLTVPVLAQETTASVIRGQVVDASDGSGIGNAKVSLLGLLISSGRVTTTDRDGWFVFNSLAPGTYTVSFCGFGGQLSIQQYRAACGT